MIRQATQKRDINTKRKWPGEDKGRGGGPAAIAKEKEIQQSYKQQGRVLPVPHGCQRDPGPVNTLSGLLALCCRERISVKGVNLL